MDQGWQEAQRWHREWPLGWAHPERSPSPPGGGASGGGGGAPGEGDGDLLTDRDLKVIEREHREGVTSVQIVDIFTQRGIRFSEATFRKYVQQGLLPRSRRVGRKGKHQGSMGLYPATTVRRINLIKRLMAQNHTIEEIQGRFLRYRDEIEAFERSGETIFRAFEEDLATSSIDAGAKKTLRRDIDEARRMADALFAEIDSIERRMARPQEGASGTGAPEGFEDLL